MVCRGCWSLERVTTEYTEHTEGRELTTEYTEYTDGEGRELTTEFPERALPGLVSICFGNFI
jgi:uncharacterized protein (DUF2237 family)